MGKSTAPFFHTCLIDFVVAVILSFLFFGFGHFEGVGVGTLPYALCAGTLVGFYNRVLERFFRRRRSVRASPAGRMGSA